MEATDVKITEKLDGAFERLHQQDGGAVTGRLIAAREAVYAGVRLLKEKEEEEKHNHGDIATLFASSEGQRVLLKNIQIGFELTFLYEALICMMGNYIEKWGALIHQKLGGSFRNKKLSVKKLSEFTENIGSYIQTQGLKVSFPHEGRELAEKLQKKFYSLHRTTITHEEELSAFRGVVVGPQGSNYQWPGKFTITPDLLAEFMQEIDTYTNYVSWFIVNNKVSGGEGGIRTLDTV